MPDPPASSTTPPRRPYADVVTTLALLAGLGVVAALASLFGGLMAMSADSCGGTPDPCEPQLDLGVTLATYGPWVTWGLAVLTCVVLRCRRCPSWWVPLVGVPVVVGVLGIGLLVARSAVPP